MNSEPESENRPAWMRFFLRMMILLGMMILQYFFFSYLGFLLASQFFDIDISKIPTLLEDGLDTPQEIHALKLIQAFISFGIFILPGIMFAKMDGTPFPQYFGFGQLKRLHIWLLFLVAITCASPLINWINQLNEQWILPGWLADIEARFGSSNDSLTQSFLQMPDMGELFINLIVFGVIAGLGEEIIFRGLLQRGLYNWLGKGHAAVWITAAIFSFIHFDFQSFLPRLLLGAILGYAYWRTGNLLLPFLLHLLNNWMAVLGAWFEQKGKQASYLEENFVFPGEWVLVSAVIVLASMGWSFYLTQKHQHEVNETF